MKKVLLMINVLLISFILIIPSAYAAEFNFCVQTSAIWQLIGYVLYALKVIIPIVIIILGTIDFAKAIIDEKDDNLSKSTGILLRRIVIGIFIFFIPTIVSVLFSLIAAASEAVSAGEACNECLNHPTGSKCDAYKATAKAQRLNS